MTLKLLRLDTINKKLLLPTLLLVMLLVGALGSILIIQQQRELTSMMESKANSLTNTLATISVQYIINYDLSALGSFVKETVKDKDVSFAEYYDADDKSLTADVMKAPADTSRLMVIQRDILGTDGKVIGKVKVGFETSALDQMLRNSIIIVLVSLAAVMGLLGLGLVFIVRTVARPVKNAIEIARVVTGGDLTQRIEVNASGEVGLLLQALKEMNESLAGIVGEVRGTTESITTASQEIAQGNSDLSQRTEQQASSLEETASSMEELTSTVKQNTENARHANQLAANASEIAVKGGQVVNDVVKTMASISTSSKKIGDIISVIEGIAFQTNILALNAAVEAARAGEQGRGFAVVAAEVRNLAQRSATAAKEIKALIDDSVDKVDAGTRQVDEAGATMNEIVAAVKRVTDIMAEIAAASDEQSTGIEEVNQAITQMDEVTQQNAALVEEAAAAAESMQGQSEALKQAVSFFKLASDKGRTQIIIARPSTKPGNVNPASKTLAPPKGERKLPKAEVDKDGEWKEF